MMSSMSLSSTMNSSPSPANSPFWNTSLRRAAGLLHGGELVLRSESAVSAVTTNQHGEGCHVHATNQRD